MSEQLRTVRICVTRMVLQTADVVALVPFGCTDAEALGWATKDPAHLRPHDESAWEDVTTTDECVTLVEDTTDYDVADFALSSRGVHLGGPHPVPFREPRDGEWFAWRGRRWATDGFVLLREDAPRPTKMLSWFGGPRTSRPLPDEGALDTLAAAARWDEAVPARLARRGAMVDGGTEYAVYEADGRLVAVNAALLGDVPVAAWVPPVRACVLRRDAAGEIVAVVMPTTMTPEEIGRIAEVSGE